MRGDFSQVIGKEADVNWDYRHSRPDGLVNDNYYSTDQVVFEYWIRPMNKGTALKFVFITSKENNAAGAVDSCYLHLWPQKSCVDRSVENEQIFELGDIPHDNLLDFATSIIKVFAPKLLDESEIEKIYGERIEE